MPALTAAELEALGVAREVAANARMTAAGFVGNAAAYERDANQRAIAAGFTSAVDQEIDANRRAREAGFLNAADLETYGAAGATRVDPLKFPFVDPRTPTASTRLPSATPINNLSVQNWIRPSGSGFVNYTVPTFRSPAYEDWTRFMPTDFQLAEFGGMHYQPGRGLLPSDASTTGTSGVGTRYTPTYTPNIGANTGVNTGGTKYPGVIPGSDKEKDLDAGRTHHPEMYDLDDMWVGAEGTGMGGETRSVGPLGNRQGASGEIESRMPTARVHDPDDPLGYSPSGPSYGTASDPGLSYASPTVSTWSQPSMTPTTTMPAYSSDPQNTAAARQAAKNMALARTLGPDKGLLSGQAEIERLSNVPGMPGYNVFNNLDSLSSPLGVTMSTPMDYINTGTDIQPFQNMTAWDDLVGDVTYDPYLPSGVTTFQSASKPTSIAPGYAAELANQARIADAQARWGSMDDSTQRTMMASAGKPDMGAMLEAMAQQQALANLSAAGGMELGGLLGMPEIEVQRTGTGLIEGGREN